MLAEDSPVKPDTALLADMIAALDAAATAGTNPPISKFHVRAATAFEHEGRRLVITGGNTEYEIPEAIHGESSMVNHAIVRVGAEAARAKVRFVAFYSQSCGTSLGCGDCRDFMCASTQSGRLLWVCGSAADRKIRVRRFADGLAAEESFPEAPPADLGITPAELQRLDGAARAAWKRGVTLFTPAEQHTAAAALTVQGAIHRAAGADDAAFHYRYPVGGALQQAATAGEYAVRAVLVVGKEGVWPRIRYRDRQYGFEFSSFGQARGQPPIRLILSDGQGRYKATTFEAALPNAFSVARFNPQAIERFLQLSKVDLR
jgi:cytidine deaminase